MFHFGHTVGRRPRGSILRSGLHLFHCLFSESQPNSRPLVTFDFIGALPAATSRVATADIHGRGVATADIRGANLRGSVVSINRSCFQRLARFLEHFMTFGAARWRVSPTVALF